MSIDDKMRKNAAFHAGTRDSHSASPNENWAHPSSFGWSNQAWYRGYMMRVVYDCGDATRVWSSPDGSEPILCSFSIFVPPTCPTRVPDRITIFSPSVTNPSDFKSRSASSTRSIHLVSPGTRGTYAAGHARYDGAL